MIPRPKLRQWKSGRPDRYLEGDKSFKDNLIPSEGGFLGIKTDLEPGQINDKNFTNLKNCFIKDGIIQKCPGYEQYGVGFPLDGICWNVFERRSYSGDRELFATTQKSLYKYNKNTFLWEYLSQNVFTGNENEIINYDLTFSETEGEMISIFTNYKDNVKYQVLGKPVSDLFTHWKAKITKNYNHYQFYGNIYENGMHYPQRFYWSTIGKPGIVTGSTEVGLYGGMMLAKSMGFITAFVPLRACFLIFKDDAMSVARWTGSAQVPFEIDENIIDVGCPAGRTPDNVGEEVLFLGNDLNVYVTDGVSHKNVSKDVRKLLVERINKDKIERAFGRVILDDKWYMLFIPTIEKDWSYEVWILNFEDWTWQYFDYFNMLDLGFSYYSTLNKYENMFCDKDGYIYHSSNDFNRDKVAFESIIDTKDFWWNRDLYKKATEIEIDCKGNGSLELWYSIDEGKTWTYKNSIILTSDWDIQSIKVDKICEKIRYRFRITGLDSYFYIRNYNPKRIDKGKII